MDYDQLIRRMKHIYRNYKEGVLQLQSEIAKDCNRAGNAIRELLPYKEAIERMGEFGRLFLEYTGCPRGHIGRSGGVSLTEEAVIMPVITDVDGGKWRPVKEDVLRDLFSRAVAEKERAEKAEKERDAAVEQLRGDCEKCANYKVTWNGCTPDFECPLSDRCLNRDMWEWNGGQKEE